MYSFKDQIHLELLYIDMYLNNYDLDLFMLFIKDYRFSRNLSSLKNFYSEEFIKNHSHENQNLRHYDSFWHSVHLLLGDWMLDQNKLVEKYLEFFFS